MPGSMPLAGGGGVEAGGGGVEAGGGGVGDGGGTAAGFPAVLVGVVRSLYSCDLVNAVA